MINATLSEFVRPRLVLRQRSHLASAGAYDDRTGYRSQLPIPGSLGQVNLEIMPFSIVSRRIAADSGRERQNMGVGPFVRGR